MNVTLYTLDCPKCRILEQKLTESGVTFEKSRDMTEIDRRGFTSVPVLKVEETYMNFNEAVKWLTERKTSNEIV